MGVKRRVTLQDVAAHAKVSATTASYALSGRGPQMRLSPEAVRRVEAAAVDLGYRPNRSARNLRMSRTSSIGLISDFVASGAFGSQMLAGASRAAWAGDHLLMIGETGGDAAVESLLIEEMLERRVDGIVYATQTAVERSVPEILRETRTVLLNNLAPAGALPAFVPDDFEGGRTAARLVIEAARTRSAWIVGVDPNPVAIAGPLRTEGIRNGFAEAGLELGGVVDCDWRVDEAHEAVERLLRQGVVPSALICLNDRIAMGSYQALADHGLRIPEDVAVVSFDGSDLAGWLRPPVTSLSLPFAELGARAVECLLAPGPLTAEIVRVPLGILRGGSLPLLLGGRRID